jgi:hypothetical protein
MEALGSGLSPSGLCTGVRSRRTRSPSANRKRARHLLVATGHEFISQGRTVLFASTFQLVQRLLAAKRDLRLTQELRKLDRFESLILDDIGYVQQGRKEMEVLVTLLATAAACSLRGTSSSASGTRSSKTR